MDDQDLRSVLREHDELERGLRAEERNRLVARLQAEIDESRAGELVPSATPIVDITAAPATERRRPPIRMAAVAALVVLAGLFLLVGPRGVSGDGDVVSEVDEPTPAPTPVATCPTAVTDFILAVDAWDGIESWASLIDVRRPDPDLPTLGAAAVAQWAALVGDDPLLIDLEVDVDEPPVDPLESAAARIARRSIPLQAAFDRMRLASRDGSGVLAPCAESIEIVAEELELPALAPAGG